MSKQVLSMPSLSSITDPSVRSALSALANSLAVRNGHAGDGSQRFITVDDLNNGIVILKGGRVGDSYAGVVADALREAARSAGDALEPDVIRIRDALSHIEAPEWFRGRMREGLQAERLERHASISTLQRKVVSETQAVASQVTKVEARLDNVGGVTVEEALDAAVFAEAIDDPAIQGGYWVRINTSDTEGNPTKVAAFALLIEQNVGEQPRSMFVVNADQFLFTTDLLDGNSAPGQAIKPFGIDKNGVYINGSLRINQTGMTLADVTAGANTISLTTTSDIFKVSRSGAPSPASIELTAVLTGDISSKSPEWSIVSGSGSATLSTVTDQNGVVTNKRVLQYNNLTTDSVMVRASISHIVDGVEVTFYDDVSIAKLRDGTDALSAKLSNGNQPVTCSPLGIPVPGQSFSTPMRVFSGASEVNYGATAAYPRVESWSVSPSELGPISVSAPSGSSKTVTVMVGTSSSISTAQTFRITANVRMHAAASLTPISEDLSVVPVKNGLDGRFITYEYSVGTVGTAGSTWNATPQQVGSGLFLWARTVLNNPASGQIEQYGTPYRVQGRDGDDGLAGYNTAVVYAYKKSATALPSNDKPPQATYIFSSKTLTFDAATSWSTSIPAGTDPLYVCVATASDRGNSDTIAANEWASPVQLTAKGVDGLKTATVDIYRRTATATAPSVSFYGSSSYSWATNRLTLSTDGSFAGWSADIPSSGGAYLWRLRATASSLTDVDNDIAASEWGNAPQLVAKDGISPPASRSAVIYAYKRAATTPADNPGAATYDFDVKRITSSLINGWSANLPAGTDTLYVVAATAMSDTQTDAIAANEWSSPVQLAADGTDGLNVATVILYARNNSTSAAPTLSTTGSATYYFGNGQVTGAPSGWTTTIPAESNGSCLWTVQATASNTAASDTIANTEWSTPVLYTKSGANAQLLVLNSDGAAFVFDDEFAPSSPSPTITFNAVTQNLTGTIVFEAKARSAAGAQLGDVSLGGSAGATRTLSAAQFATYANTKTVTVTASLGGFSDSVVVSRVDGGASSVYAELSNDSHPIAAAADGTATSPHENSGTEIRVKEGVGTLLTYDGIGASAGKWTVSAAGTSITPGAISNSGGIALVASHSGMPQAATSAKVVYTITGKSTTGAPFTIVSTQTFSKTKSGATGGAGAIGTRGTIFTKISGAWNATTAAAQIASIASAAGASPTTPIKGDIVAYTGGAKECTAAGNPGTWANVGSFIDGSMVVTGTIAADHIVANSIAVATSYNISNQAISTVLAFATPITSSNTGLIQDITVANTSNVPMKITMNGAGRTGVTVSDTGYQTFGVFVGTTLVYDYGWTPINQDAKSFALVYTIPAGGSVTFSVRGAKSNASAVLNMWMAITVLGVKN